MSEVVKLKPEDKPAAPLELQGGVMAARTNAEAWRIANALSSSALVPNDYRSKPENILIAMDMGASLGLTPAQSVQRISVINGRPSVWGDAIPSILRDRGYKLTVRTEGSLSKGDMEVTAEVTCPNGDVEVSSFSVEDAKLAGLWGKAGPWKQYPKRMLRHRAVGFAARDAGALTGLMMAEEAMDLAPAPMRDITPRDELPGRRELPEHIGNLPEEPERQEIDGGASVPGRDEDAKPSGEGGVDPFEALHQEIISELIDRSKAGADLAGALEIRADRLKECASKDPDRYEQIMTDFHAYREEAESKAESDG